MRMLNSLLHYLFFISAVTYANEVPRVVTPSGTIEGFVGASADGSPYFGFHGVPYAEPPIGENRFKEPIPKKPWNGTWKAVTKYQCLQYTAFPRSKEEPVEGTEDCLYLNIYTPQLDNNFDVFVFIHGGGFMLGQGTTFKPDILLDNKVVYVTLNYRLGPLGFLSTEDNILPGNNGMRDQTLALKWIKNNIQHFGGNSNSITISGVSAGGASVHSHMISPTSKGLFHKAISMSGCILNPWVFMETPLEKTKMVATSVGCNIDNNLDMVDCLRKRPAYQIVHTVKNFQPWLYNPFSPLGLVVDGNWSTDPVFPKHPYLMLKEAPVNDIPWILSHVTAEGLYNAATFYEPEYIQYIDKHWNNVMPHILHYNFTIPTADMDQVSEKIRQEYLGTQHLRKQNFDKLIKMMSDRLFEVDLDKCSRLQAASMKSALWYYVFNYGGDHSLSEKFGKSNGFLGVCHGDDTLFVVEEKYKTEEDISMSKLLTNTFLTFANSGEPKIKSWLPVSKSEKDARAYLKIDSPSSISYEWARSFGNRNFWDQIPFRENERLVG